MVYTFNTPQCICYKILQEINNHNVQMFYLGKFCDLANLIEKERFDYILGLGNFRKSEKFIRVETVYRNWYGNKKIQKIGQEYYEATWKLSTNDGVVLSASTTIGPCNRTAYKICQMIKKNNLQTKMTLVHIPKGFKIIEARTTIEEWLKEG